MCRQRKECGVNEAELVLTHILRCDRMSLYLNKDTGLDKDKSVILSSILKRRMLGEPVQYILGRCEFMGLEFKIDRRALIPRPETEILVESAIGGLRDSGNARPRVLEIGTGSGCIAVAIARNIKGADIWASDISQEALQLAGENARCNNTRIRFVRGDLFDALHPEDGKFDLIISNPPYVAEVDFSSLAREISFEPQAALNGGRDGLDFYRRIITGAAAYLENSGSLMFEIGMGQAGVVKRMLENEGFGCLSSVRDYNGIERVVSAKKGMF
ncbi:MAG: peptide chain release factor N(5)-glutamine methyltransferase [Candidatus Omnitrophica bacterium]|nr:peptide chain release factor N(5)-glutamine methyltransferase [Candidatus Omnitrophota bacterium]MDD5771057.1 peptide chain release factor N(5)-glutamine methyltransferase [Candidatus Omnitrophota bacterium]